MSLEEKKTKKLSLDNFSKFLSPSARKKKSLSSSMSTLSDSVLSRNSTIQSTSTISFQETIDSSSHSPPSIAESYQSSNLQQQIQSKRRILAELNEQHKHYSFQNHQLSEQLSRIQEKSERKLQELEVQRTKYSQHLTSLRSTKDDPTSISERLTDFRNHITEISKELLPHVSHTDRSARFKSLWLNLSGPIDKLDLTRGDTIQMLTEKFIMDVLIPNLSTNQYPGLPRHTDSIVRLQDWLDEHTQSTFYSTRLRQELATAVCADDETQEEYIKKNWRYLYRGLQRVYPVLKEKQQERLRLRRLAEEAVSLGLAIKGQENQILATDVKEGSQPLDTFLMEEVHGKSSGIVLLCISPPFVIKMNEDTYHVLEKGLVLCQD